MSNNYLIAGGTSGIGRACAESLAANGDKVFVLGRSADKLDEMSTHYPQKIIPIQYDLNDVDNIANIFIVIEENRVKLDGLVYCAGMDATFPVKANRPQLMQSLLTVNCVAFVEICKFFYSKRISNDNSSIVAISSIASLTNEKGMVAYSASKAALNSSVKTISKEFCKRHIRVNAILPSGVDTDMAKKKIELIDNSVNSSAGEDPQPYGIISVDSVVRLIEFLLSESSNYMTGELLTMSAGRSY